MTMGIIEATTSAIGEELNMLFGFSVTRLTAQALAEQIYQSGLNTMNYDGNVTCTLTAGAFLTGVVNGMRLRILSGVAAGLEALVSLRNSGTQITLQSPILGASSFTGASWELVIDATTTLNVESTIDFPASGRAVVDGVLYLFSGKTATTLTGIQYDDGTGILIDGVKQEHDTLALVADFSRALSAIDQYRRSFLVAYAGGVDLNTLGANLGVQRPPELSDDDTFRELVEALAYSPRGTIFAMEQVMDVLLGETQIASGTKNASGSGNPLIVALASGTFPTGIEGMRFRVKSGYNAGRTIRIKSRVDSTHIQLNIPMDESFTLQSWEITDPNWEIFEDLTLGSIHHGCTVFFRRKDSPTVSAGKAFLDGEDYRPLTNSTTLNYSGFGEKRICSVRLKDEGGIQQIASGTGASAASSPDGLNLTGAVNSFSTLIQPGDYFQITSGSLKGLTGLVQVRVSSAALTLGLVDGAPNPSPTSTGGIGSAFTGVSWQVLRDKTNCRLYKPSAESRLEYPGDSGTQTWDYVGANESTRVDVSVDGTYGARLLITPASDVVAYRRKLRISPEADAMVEMSLDVGTPLATEGTNAKQICCLLSDGERTLAWGVQDKSDHSEARVGFIDMTTGAFIGSSPSTKPPWSAVVGAKYSPGVNHIRMVKHGRNTVYLYRQAYQGALLTLGWELIDSISYTSFPAVASWVAGAPYGTATAYEIAWGVIEAGHTGTMVVKYVDWQVSNPIDYWNIRHTGQTTANPNALTDAANTFQNTDVGKKVRIHDFGALNASHGNSHGIWDIGSYIDAKHVTLVGETHYGGQFTIENRSWLVVRGDTPFVWPDHRGCSVQILDGVNAHTCPILAIIDPGTLDNVENLPLPATIADSVNWTSRSKQVFTQSSSIVLLDTSGLPGGKFTITDVECTWRLVPNFPADSAVSYELVDAGSDALGVLTFRSALPWGAGQVMAIHASKVLSAYLFHEHDGNALTGNPPPTYQMYPFYLYDGFGYIRQVMQLVKAAGILPDFDDLFSDAAGHHILDPGD